MKKNRDGTRQQLQNTRWIKYAKIEKENILKPTIEKHNKHKSSNGNAHF